MRVEIRRDIGRWPGLAVGVRLLLPMLLSVGVGCASLPSAPAKTPWMAYDRPQSTVSGALVADAAAAHPGSSGFALVRSGRDALAVRLFLTELAEESRHDGWSAPGNGDGLATLLRGQPGDRKRDCSGGVAAVHTN